MNTQVNIDKENVYQFLKKMNTDLVNKVNEMKQDFEKNPPVINQNSSIKDRFLKWKSAYSDIVNGALKEFIFLPETDQNAFDFKEFLNKITEEYQNENDFLEMLKTLNQEIENLKEFIKGHLVKDPSIYFVKEI